MSVSQIDQPLHSVSDDRLSLDSQVKGFSDFVLKCETPMTIAIQGRWGSGKTSFVNMVQTAIQDQLGDMADLKCPFITFNAWQFSQFNLQAHLATSMLSALTQELAKGMPDQSSRGSKAVHKVLDCVNKIGRLAAFSVNDFVEKKSGIDFVGRVHQVFSDDSARTDDETVSSILSLRSSFETCVLERLGLTDDGNNKDYRRLVIFVDDLDRLSPEKAIEVLEILKLFLDCRNCLFILAIDYNVVLNGVSIKYRNTLSADKGAEFFEKMIQVVYTMPELLPHTDRLIASSLHDNGQNISIAPDFSALIRAARKNTPRSIKRILNSYYLLNKIQQYDHDGQFYDCQDDAIALFATLCLQIENQRLFNFLQNDPDSISAGLLNFLTRLVFQKSLSPSAAPHALDLLNQMGLTDDHGTLSIPHCQFLEVFLREIYYSGGTDIDYSDRFSADSEFQDRHVTMLRHCLDLTELSRVHSRCFTEYDAVAGILMYDLELTPTTSGTIQEAFSTTVSEMISSFTPAMLKPILQRMDQIFSLNPHHFLHTGRIALRVHVRTVNGLAALLAPEEANTRWLYYDADLTPNQLVQTALLLAYQLDFSFTWFSDRTLSTVLVKLDGRSGPAPVLDEMEALCPTCLENWCLDMDVRDTPDSEDIIDITQMSLEEAVRETGLEENEINSMMQPIQWADDLMDDFSDDDFPDLDSDELQTDSVVLDASCAEDDSFPSMEDNGPDTTDEEDSLLSQLNTLLL